MEDRKLLYSLMEGVLIIYNEHNKVANESKHHLLQAQNTLADAHSLFPWRLILLMMSVWLLTVLTWVALSLHACKAPSSSCDDDDGMPAAQRMQGGARRRRNPFAPNYHTHFHCNCGKQQHLHDSPQMMQLDDDELFRELDGHREVGDAMFEVHHDAAPPRSLDSHSADELPNMQIAGATYEISV